MAICTFKSLAWENFGIFECLIYWSVYRESEQNGSPNMWKYFLCNDPIQ